MKKKPLENNTKIEGVGMQKSALWVSVSFYMLVAFEFFYMASPFAAYFYGIYGPGLEIIGNDSTTSWLTSFFLPHIIAQTRSSFVNAHNFIGVTLMIAGMVSFAVGAFQIYSSKLRKGGAVQGGLYRWVRHPQYISLIVSSFGMLLVWPRFLVLFSFVTVVFVYVTLARAEERLCSRLFPDYTSYAKGKGMFLPAVIEAPFAAIPFPRNKWGNAATWIGLFIFALTIVGISGRSIKSHAINSLYAVYTSQSATVSIGALEQVAIKEIHATALTSPEVAEALAKEREDGHPLFLNYVLPIEFYISEIPMHLPPGTRTGHTFPSAHDRNLYKIIFTRAEMASENTGGGAGILQNATNKHPVIEAWVDRKTGTVLHTFQPPEHAFYNGMPVPIF